MTELVELATRFVSLSAELDAVRNAMKRLLLNGSSEPANPTPPPGTTQGARPGSGKTPRLEARTRLQPDAKGLEAKRIAAAKAEEAIVELLRATPGLRTGAIAKAAGAPLSSTANRLERLLARAQVQRGEDEGWRAVSPPH